MNSISFDDVQRFVTLVSQSTLAEVEISHGTSKLKVVNHLTTPQAPCAVAMPTTPSYESPSPAINQNTIVSKAVGVLCFDGIALKAGDTVNVGDTVAGVLALGVLTPVVADKAGVIESFLLNEGDKVEWGQAVIALV